MYINSTSSYKMATAKLEFFRLECLSNIPRTKVLFLMLKSQRHL